MKKSNWELQINALLRMAVWVSLCFSSLHMLAKDGFAYTEVLNDSMVYTSADSTKQPQAPMKDTAKAPNKVMVFFTKIFHIQLGKGFLIPSPLFNYSPETSLGIGGTLLYNFRFPGNDSTTYISNAQTAAIFTLKGQIIFQPKWTFYIGKDQYRVWGDFTYRKYPDLFFGIGNDTRKADKQRYTAKYIQFRPFFAAKVIPHLYLGVQYREEYMFGIHPIDAGILTQEKSLVPGGNGYFASGFGLNVLYDTRDNANFPYKGTYISLSNYCYNSIFGSKVKSNNVTLDIRQFYSPYKKMVFAFQGYAEINAGDVPFKMMAELGGPYLMRGFYKGEYRDKNILLFQAEYRFPIYWRFNGVVFGSTGDVFNNPTDLSLRLLKLAGGAGLRFTIDEKERLNLRFDVAYGRFGQSGYYISFLEAF